MSGLITFLPVFGGDRDFRRCPMVFFFGTLDGLAPFLVVDDLLFPLPVLPRPALVSFLLVVGVFRKFSIRLSFLFCLESFCSGFGVGASGGECLDLFGVLLPLLLVEGVLVMLL